MGSEPEILEGAPEARPVNIKAMPLWRKTEIALGLLRGLLRGLARGTQMPIVHKHVKVRRSNAKIELGRFCEFHDRCVLSIITPPDKPAGKLSIGGMTSVWYGTVISARYEITIGSHCAISSGCTILDDDMHEVLFLEGDKPREKGHYVRIGDHVWIGTACTILKGVKIGSNSVVAAGSIVTRDVPPNTLVAGAPAKVVKEIKGWR